jgi:hypothetical protein
VDLDIHSLIRLHGGVLNWLSAGIVYPFKFRVKFLLAAWEYLYIGSIRSAIGT